MKQGGKKFDDYNRDEVVLNGELNSLYVVNPDTYLKKRSLLWKKKLKNKKKIELIANHLHQTRGRALDTVTVRGELLLNSKNPASDDEASDEDDTVVLAETCYTDSEGKSSDSVSVNESDGDTELPSPANRRCYTTRSGRSATRFAFRRFTTN